MIHLFVDIIMGLGTGMRIKNISAIIIYDVIIQIGYCKLYNAIQKT